MPCLAGMNRPETALQPSQHAHEPPPLCGVLRQDDVHTGTGRAICDELPPRGRSLPHSIATANDTTAEVGRADPFSHYSAKSSVLQDWLFARSLAGP